jgi:ABC-2 type transport system permease protein
MERGITMIDTYFSWHRFWAVLIKEFIQMKRDRLTFAMIVVIPIMQLVLFGYAINADPKSLPTAVVSADYGPMSRSLIKGLENSEYFRITHGNVTQSQGQRMLDTGEVQFVVNIPENFNRNVLRGERPAVLMEADATDPTATANALAVVNVLNQTILNQDLKGAQTKLQGSPPPFKIIVHRQYNPEALTEYNIVPGLIGTVLTLTMVMIAAMAVTRETERGTLENLLSTPVRPIEVMFGKIIPFIIVGFIQVLVILVFAKLLFNVPMVGGILLLSITIVIFISANLSVGYTFSTLSKNQLQASQMGTFFFLPSILLSGFLFPFRGMPDWAQTIGNIFPLTHFLRIVRGILLKGNGFVEIWPNLWPILLFMLLATSLAISRYRETLD